MAIYKATGKYRVGKAEHVFQISILIYFEDGYWYWVAPSLDLVGAGETEKQAEASFNVVLGEFIKYTYNKETIYQELKKLGWHVSDEAKNNKHPLIYKKDKLQMADLETCFHYSRQVFLGYKYTRVV